MEGSMRSFERRHAAMPIAAVLGLCLSGCGNDTTTPTPVASGPISLTCSASPTAGTVPLTVSLAVKVTPTPQSLTIQYGDGTSSNNPNELHVYKTPGTFSLVVNASSGVNSASCTQTITTNPVPARPPNRPPVARFRINPDPAVGSAPLFVAFNACGSTDPDGDRLKYFFDFGDGVTTSSRLCRDDHTYARGTYTAKVCVTDEQPGDDVCRTFLVRAQ
jgi:PKD repeat protein